MLGRRRERTSARGAGRLCLLYPLALAGCSDAAPPLPPCETFDTGFAQELALLTEPLSPRPPALVSELITASSYDRRSEVPGSPDWFKNYDRGAYLGRDSRGHGILMEHHGPGALLRLWSANPHGTLRIYVDDQREPLIEVPLATFLSEDNALGAAFGYSVTISAPGEYGANFYAPIPFERYLRVTHEGPAGEDLFWHAAIKAYEPGVCAASFTPEAAPATALEEATDALVSAHPAPETLLDVDWSPATATHAWEAGESGGELQALCLASDTAFDSARTVVELRFDGVTTVRAPLRDFFAGFADEQTGANFYTSHDAETGEWCTRFRMPFRDTAELRVIAPSAEPERALRLRYTLAEVPFEDARYFHAQWRRTPDVVQNSSDQLAVSIEAGGGQFVGLVLAATNRSRCWWGEGDDKIFVDGEDFPRHFGTGTEDYFGYAWASHEVFVEPFHGQTEAEVGRGNDTCGRGENLGGTWWNYRFHQLDPIDFEASLRFYMEVWHWAQDEAGVAPLVEAFTGFWYGNAAQAAPAIGDLGTRPGVWSEL